MGVSTTMEEFKIGDPILYRVKNDKTAVWYPSIYLGMGINRCMHLSDGSSLQSERFTIVPLTEDTMQHICTNHDIRVPWEPKRGELVAVKDRGETHWKAMVFVKKCEEGQFLCAYFDTMEENDMCPWDECEPLHKHFNVPKCPEDA